MTSVSVWLWVGFVGFVLGMLALDLGVFNRKAHAISLREAAIWSSVWIGLSLLFNAVLFFWQGPGKRAFCIRVPPCCPTRLFYHINRERGGAPRC